MRSLRGKLIVGILSGMALLLMAGGAATYLTAKRRLYADFENELVERLRLLAALVDLEHGRLELPWLESETGPTGPIAGIDFFAVWSGNDPRPIATSPNMSGFSLPRLPGTLAQPGRQVMVLADGTSLHCAGVQFDALNNLHKADESAVAEPDEPTDGLAVDSAETKVHLVVAKEDRVAPTLAVIRWPLLGTGIVSTLFAWLVIQLVVQRSLRPLDQLQAQIRRLEENASLRRIVVPNQVTELEPVTEELNRLLERVDQALARERRLTSSVAHELRTPIAGLLATLELAMNRPRTTGEHLESAGECLEIAKRMNWLVNNLLSITRIEAGNVRLQKQEVVLSAALTEWWKPFQARAERRGLRVDWQLDSEGCVETDPEFLRVVISNLFDNAVSYAPEGDKIRIQLHRDGSVSVANQAVALGANTLTRAFDPYWRAETSQSQDVPHAGLGLNLCKQVIQLLGGRIAAEHEASAGQFVVHFQLG